MTADGTEDHRISLEGLPYYRIPPPVLYLRICKYESLTISPDSHDDIEEEEDVLDEDKDQPDMKELNEKIRKEIGQFIMNFVIKC